MEQTELEVSLQEVMLKGFLTIPEGAKGIVLFCHGSGSSRFSPRNQYVAKVISDAGVATFLFDLLSPEEEAVDLQTASLRFDIPFMAKRVVEVTEWLKKQQDVQGLKFGYFGSSTGAAAALVAAAGRVDIYSVVSRGGRPDLAQSALSEVNVPTLFLVGGNDLEVIALNELAYEKLQCEKKMEIIPNATHLFEEPGTLEKVAEIAAKWFVLTLNRSPN